MYRRVYLYAFNGLHKLEECYYLANGRITVTNIKSTAKWMMDTNPSVKTVYMIDNRAGLYSDYREATRTFDFVKHYEFEDMVSHEGLLIMKR